MNILMFSGDYWPNTGGIAYHVSEISRALDRLGAHVTVIGGYQGGLPRPEAALQGMTAASTEVLISRKGPHYVRGILFLAEAFLRLRKLARREWNVLHFHNFLPDGLLLGWARWPHANVRVITNHSSQFLTAVAQSRSMSVYKLLSQSADGFVAPSRELAHATTPLLRSGQRTEYIPNGVDTDRFSPGFPSARAYQVLGVDRSRTIIMSVRRHTPKCGLEYLIRAVPAIARKRPDAVFCLLGSGEITDALRSLADSLGVEEIVKFPGVIDHTLLPELLRAAYVTILPSLYEAVSLAGLESMACGVPVIGSRVGGIPEFVQDHRTGLLMEPGSAGAIAEAVLELLEEPDLRSAMSVACRELVLKHFTWGEVARRLLAFYEELGRTRDRT